MFSWFRAKPPLDTAEKAWTEAAMRRLADWFGIDALLRAEFVIPDEYASDFDGSKEYARAIFHDICAGMQVPRGELKIEFLDDRQLHDAVGHYDRYAGVPRGAAGSAPIPIVRLRRSQLSDLCQLTATIAHEVAHHKLLGGGFHAGDEYDLEPTTDLLPVFFGYGLFLANATVRFTATHTGNWEQWSISRQGYLPSRIFGYALALAAAFRGERRPRWSQALRPDAKEPFHRGERYLSTGDSLFLPDSYTRSAPPPSTNELFHCLSEGSATVRYDALCELERRLTDGPIRFSPADARTVASFLRDRDVAVAVMTAHVLSACGGLPQGIVRELKREVWGPRTPVRAAAIIGLGRLGVDDDEMIDSLRRLLTVDEAEVVAAVAAAATSLGSRAAALERPLLELLEQANIRGADEATKYAARALTAVSSDPIASVKARYQGGDPELRMLALGAVRFVLRAKQAAGDGATPA